MIVISEENKILKIGVIGCGDIIDYIKPVSESLERIDIIAAVDPAIEKAIKIAGQEHSYNDADKMYKNEDIDAVYIATPHNLHKPMIKQALEEGKHVFCEKPVANTIKEARGILKYEKNYPKLKIGFNYQYRYDFNCYNLAMGVNNRHLGKPYYANCNIYFSRDLEYFNAGGWRTDPRTAGGGTMLAHGSHIIDVIIWAFGNPISVMGKIDNLKFKNIKIEDIGFALVKFENGTYAQINDSIIIKPRKKRIEDRIELNIFGEEGSCYYEGPWPFSSLKWYGVKDYKLKENPPGISHFKECLKAFGDWILDDIPFLNTVEESSKVLCLISALYKSSISGKEEIVEKL